MEELNKSRSRGQRQEPERICRCHIKKVTLATESTPPLGVVPLMLQSSKDGYYHLNIAVHTPE